MVVVPEISYASPGVCRSTSPFAILSDSARLRSSDWGIKAEQLLQSRVFGGIAPLLLRQLPRDEIQRVDGDAELEGVVALDRPA